MTAEIDIVQEAAAVLLVRCSNAVFFENCDFTKTLQFETDGLPALPFFVRLMRELDVPAESIVCMNWSHDDGCPTCGHGAGISYVWQVTLAS